MSERILNSDLNSSNLISSWHVDLYLHMPLSDGIILQDTEGINNKEGQLIAIGVTFYGGFITFSSPARLRTALIHSLPPLIAVSRWRPSGTISNVFGSRDRS